MIKLTTESRIIILPGKDPPGKDPPNPPRIIN
jgi:hypothetical protein